MIIGEYSVFQQVGATNVVVDDQFDLMIGVLSWEQRCSASFSVTSGADLDLTMLRFKSHSTAMDDQKTAQLTKIQAYAKSVAVVELEPSTEFQPNADAIEKLIRNISSQKGRPLRILMDITCFPKSYMLLFVGMSLAQGYASSIKCLYAEGEYALDVAHSSLRADASAKIGIISEGDWSTLQIPYMESEIAIPSTRDLIVAMGGEVGLSLPFLEKYEPSNIDIILIAESLVQHPERLPDNERHAIQDMLAQPNTSRVNVNLSDLLSFVEEAVRFAAVSKAEVVTGIALGSKPHALALGLAALSRENIEVVCRVPKRYRPLDVLPAARFSVYTIEDRFEPTVYYRG